MFPKASRSTLARLDPSRDAGLQVTRLFSASWSGAFTPPLCGIYEITQSSISDDRLIFTNIPASCALRRDFCLQQDFKPCGMSVCAMCSVVQTSFDIERDAPLSSSQRPFGVAIYATRSASWADRCTYGTAWSGEGIRALLVSHVAASKPYRTQRASQLRKPPPGFDSVVAIPGIDFSHEEVAVYNAASIHPAYVILYGTQAAPTLPSPPRSFVEATSKHQSFMSSSTQHAVQASVELRALSQPTPDNDITIPAEPRPTSKEAALLFSSAVLQRVKNLIRINNSHHTMGRVVLQIRALETAVSLPEGAASVDMLEGEDLQQFLNLLQEQIMDDPYLWLSEGLHPDTAFYAKLRAQLRHVIMSISVSTALLPSSLFLRGVACVDKESIGGGSFGEVFRGEFNSGPVALKKLRVFRTTDEAKKEVLRKEFYKESLFWKNINHPHILPFLGVDNIAFKDSFCMVLPWMSNGNVRSLMTTLRTENRMSDRMLFFMVHRWLREISAGLAYLHNEHVVHADLRGPNILVDVDMGIRVADFGMALFSDANSTYGSGANRWMAPELFSTDADVEDDDPKYRPACASDVYSLGHVISELYTLKDPFFGLNDYQVVSRILKGVRPARFTFVDDTAMPNALWDLTTRCWAHEPSQRPSATEVNSKLSEIANALDGYAGM
ncbi:hypothetical protein EIP91_009110 [Steccherinum ochraceum]|uniref:Protein kinase domain-containing protein n=1 Tax=Steccherinum ochraceum TaxID=92696 RepID=A0A4R0R4Q9_9APHY|nr:hypothetical protein EIP91_009110 [Steccherinum ochraceum]